MKNNYVKPELRAVDLFLDSAFCLSDVDGAGGSTSDYGEDDETLFP
jgi:hypothetical protein